MSKKGSSIHRSSIRKGGMSNSSYAGTTTRIKKVGNNEFTDEEHK